MITFGELKTAIRSVLWPSPGEARNLREAHDIFFREAMVELGKKVAPCLRLNHHTVFDACSTYVHCAKSVMDAPRGIIRRVYTVANDDYCDPVYYRSRTFAELECFARRASRDWTAPSNMGLDALPSGFKFHESSIDSPCGRARVGVYAIHNRRLYLAPWIQSNEAVIVEWDGWKMDWADNDQIEDEEWDDTVKSAVRAYVKWKHEIYYGCDPAKRLELKREWEMCVADAIHWCDQQTKDRSMEEPISCDRDPTYNEVSDDAAPVEEEEEIFFANTGDYGSLGDLPGVLNVSALIKSMSPEFIISNGDNDYDGDYDQSVGQFYAQYLFPYDGNYGPGATEQMLFPVAGNHDWDVDGTLDAYKEFFNQSRTYYELVKGPVHFFMMSSDTREPDGATAESIQAGWLRAKLALSPAQWKIVVIHDPPYCSASNDAPGILRSRWPFKDWGADLVLSGDGHFYERLEVEGLPYIVNGAGGRALRTFTTPIDESLVRYNDDWGAGFCRINCNTLTYEFHNTAGVLIDTLILTK